MSFASLADFETALHFLTGPDPATIAAATERQNHLTKPVGSLGRLEDIAVFFAGWQGQTIPAINQGRSLVFAGNHGFVVHGVSAYPAEVTLQMVANFNAGGASINALAEAAGLDLRIHPIELDRPTDDFTQGPAMSEEDCLAALSVGANAVDPSLDLIIVGEMGIGNSTAAAAIAARTYGGDVAPWVGPGTGVNSDGIARKIAVIEQALACHADAPRTAFETLRRVGGREIAAIAGAVLRARQLRIPVVVDGFICTSALAPLAAENASITDHCIAGHCSAEPGHKMMLDRLGLTPLLNLNMRLGEGSGAAVAVQVIRSALAAHAHMATFAEAGVSGR